MKRNVSATQPSVREICPVGTKSGVDANVIPAVSAPIPRPPRRRQKSKLDRGLPNDSDLARLAEAYLERQRRNYPVAAQCGVVMPPSPETIQAMVEDFKRRHRGGAIEVDPIKTLLKKVGASKAGGAYSRFSCHNSKPTSILDQLMKSLEKSQSESRFIPWVYVFADFAVTGLDASRQGYTSYKNVLSDKQHMIETTYLDDFSRASRDELEWWRLAALSKRLRKRMIGASDGFDLDSDHSELLMWMFGLLSRLFLKSLREKVGRGMKGAADRGENLGRLSFGFTRRQKLDGAGNPMTRRDGRPQYERCHDPDTSKKLSKKPVRLIIAWP